MPGSAFEAILPTGAPHRLNAPDTESASTRVPE